MKNVDYGPCVFWLFKYRWSSLFRLELGGYINSDGACSGGFDPIVLMKPTDLFKGDGKRLSVGSLLLGLVVASFLLVRSMYLFHTRKYVIQMPFMTYANVSIKNH